ncbi:hypothetical protein BdWA1_002899 [Babesia duncani]|uniref:Uncharacterized protein n=1 Tax=Babesia duncani TaxID=323732 RepID=A0AAD9PI09_9APIC|nr:hypothetical protein BdWA1_002899 [Babesia duncani]
MPDSIAYDATETSGRCTRWSNARRIGVDPRSLFGNRKYGQGDGDYGISTRRTNRKSHSSSDNPNLEYETIWLTEDYSEDEIQEPPVTNFDTTRAINTLSEIVTRIITENINVDIDSYVKLEPNENLNELLKQHDIPGVVESISNVNGLCDEMLQEKKINTTKREATFVSYLLIEFIGLKGTFYQSKAKIIEDAINLMKSAEHVKLLNQILPIFRRFALTNLEDLRSRIPTKAQYSGVLDFRPWRRLLCEYSLDQAVDDYQHLLIDLGLEKAPLDFDFNEAEIIVEIDNGPPPQDATTPADWFSHHQPNSSLFSSGDDFKVPKRSNCTGKKSSGHYGYGFMG